MQAFRAVLNTALVAVLTIIGAIAALIFRLFDSSGDSVVKLARWWSTCICALSGVKIDVSVYSWTDVDRKVKELVDAGKAPDMAQIGAYADYADKNLLYTADDLLSISTQADFASQLATAGQVNGAQYGMPFAGR